MGQVAHGIEGADADLVNLDDYLPHVVGPATGVGSEERIIEWFREILHYRQ